VVVVKLHGDYRDARMKNTKTELASYDPPVVSLLKRIFSEYGLIVCGWSAEWDEALQALLKESAPSPHYGTFWTIRRMPATHAQETIDARAAAVEMIENADEFFDDLHARVAALEELRAGEQLEPAVAVGTLKRYLPDPVHRIRLHDFVERHAERTTRLLTQHQEPVHLSLDQAIHIGAIEQSEADVDVLARLFGLGCAWSDGPEVISMWLRIMKGLADLEDPAPELDAVVENRRRYPALQCLYAGGIGALATNRYRTLVALLENGRVRIKHRDEPFIYAVNVETASSGIRVSGRQALAAASFRLHDLAQDRLHDVVRDDARLTVLFDLFEYLVGLAVFALGKDWAPTGAFRVRHHDEARMEASRGPRLGPHPMQIVGAEIEEQGDQWPMLQAGFLGGSIERLREAQDGYRVYIRRLALSDEQQLRWGMTS
jgi:hypothetical protein